MDDLDQPPLQIEELSEPLPGLVDLLAEYQVELDDAYPPECRHALDLNQLFRPEIRVFLASVGSKPVGCGGMETFSDYAELKRFYVTPSHRGQGVAHAILNHIESQAKSNGLRKLRLETGVYQKAGMRFYEKSGYVPCPAFGRYVEMPPENLRLNLFFEKDLI